ncbi:TerB family tellurite resistance protein [Azospirillum soli]|uniref:TerB family tellurite resistance protein n=1 Tax=Azospirillum soli TaxID=1304799 RepID=UPI001AE2CA33|nr:TerB family tellurite resistance protein [Azospirillum soli]MBP2312010.1 tellurite resistance protein [Azospirillum soli]
MANIDDTPNTASNIGPNEDEAQAVAAGCALLATVEDADPGTVRERLRALLSAANLPPDTLDEAARAFDGHTRHIQDDPTAGEADAMGLLRQVKGDVNAAKRTMETCRDAADGNGGLSPAQAAMARKLCESLNLSPTQFGL